MFNFSKPSKPSILTSLKTGLKRTRDSMLGGMANLLLGEKELDDQVLEEIETQLLVADVGMVATQQVITELTARVKRKELANSAALLQALRQLLAEMLKPCSAELTVDGETKPYVILMVGVNGAGKTTTIGKLAKRLQQQGKSVMLAAADTFRAAAIEQLQVWGERNAVPVIAQKPGSDSASVAYDALQAAKARSIDVLIIDTAGRLHTQSNLMEELKKVHRVLGKIDAQAPHEVLLVLDASVGQNALVQAQQFKATVQVTGLALTKLDGTAKGGIIFAIAQDLGLPIRFIGIGERVEDLRPFVAEQFVDALFARE